MSEPTHAESRIFRHMTPATIASWVSDLDEATILESTDNTDTAIMYSAICELFALVGMEALNTLATYGIDADHPLVVAGVAAYNEDKP